MDATLTTEKLVNSIPYIWMLEILSCMLDIEKVYDQVNRKYSDILLVENWIWIEVETLDLVYL